jgi:hypothetical protein
MPAFAKRPGIVTFVAVVLIVLGSLALLLGICGVGGQIVIAMIPEPVGKPRPDDLLALMLAAPRFLAKEVPGYMAAQIIHVVAYFGFGLTQLFAGIGCLRLRPAARKAAMATTVLYLAYSFAFQAYTAIFVLPANVELQKQQQANMPPGAPDMSSMAQVSGAMTLGCFIATDITIAVLILIGLNTQSAKAAFAVVPFEPSAEEDDDEARDSNDPRDRRSKFKGYEEHDE